MKINKMQERYLLDELFGLTLGATVQRAGVYKRGLTEQQRTPFQHGLRVALERAARGYSHSVDSDQHMKRIEAFAIKLSRRHADVLANRRLRIGVAQKALNLYLKYLWCAGRIPEPPHCPFDAIVITRLQGHKSRVNWTKFDDIGTYRRLVVAAETAAKGTSLAMWELREYNKKSAAALRAKRMP